MTATGKTIEKIFYAQDSHPDAIAIRMREGDRKAISPEDSDQLVNYAKQIGKMITQNNNIDTDDLSQFALIVKDLGNSTSFKCYYRTFNKIMNAFLKSIE